MSIRIRDIPVLLAFVCVLILAYAYYVGGSHLTVAVGSLVISAAAIGFYLIFNWSEIAVYLLSRIFKN